MSKKISMSVAEFEAAIAKARNEGRSERKAARSLPKDSGVHDRGEMSGDRVNNVVARNVSIVPGKAPVYGHVRMVEKDGKFQPFYRVSDAEAMTFGIGVTGDAKTAVAHAAHVASQAPAIIAALAKAYAAKAPTWMFVTAAEKAAAKKAAAS